MEKFAIVMHRDPEPAPVEVWGVRLFGVLRAVCDRGGIERILYWESRDHVREVPVEPEAVTEHLRSRPVSVDDAGVSHPEAGIVAMLAGVAAGDRDDDSLCEISLSTGEWGPAPNSCIVKFWRRVPPDPMPGLFADCVSALSPAWAAVESRTNLLERTDEEEETGAPPVPVDTMLHWHTYFAAEHVRSTEVASLQGRDEVVIRELHEGVEVVLGERWEGNEALRRRQRELEPLLFNRRAVS